MVTPLPSFPPGTLSAASPRPGRLVVPLTLVFLAGLWAFVVYWGISSRQETVASTEQVLRRMDYAVEEQTRRLFRMVEIFLDAADQWIADRPDVDPRRDPSFLRLVEHFRQQTGRAVDVRLAAADGTRYVLGGSLPPDERALGDKDYFRAAIGGDQRHFHIGAPEIEAPGAAWRIPVAHRLTRQMPGVAALVATVELSTLVSLYEEVRIRPGGAIVLLHRDGTLLARAPHDERLVGASLAGGQLYRDLLPRAERGFGRIERTLTDGMEKYVAYSALGDLPLVMAVSAATGDVLAPWRRQVTVVTVLAAVISLAALLVAVRLAQVLGELSARNEELLQLTTTDPMTGTGNRHHFLTVFAREFARARRHGSALSLMILDLDFFKQINDGYGHATGDEALRAFARATAGCLREIDAIGRLGGEEFAILLPGTAAEAAQAVAERVRKAVARIAIDSEGSTVRFTASIGLTEVADEDESVDDVLGRADAALYTAKAAGRNRVILRLAGDTHSRF